MRGNDDRNLDFRTLCQVVTFLDSGSSQAEIGGRDNPGTGIGMGGIKDRAGDFYSWITSSFHAVPQSTS